MCHSVHSWAQKPTGPFPFLWSKKGFFNKTKMKYDVLMFIRVESVRLKANATITYRDSPSIPGKEWLSLLATIYMRALGSTQPQVYWVLGKNFPFPPTANIRNM
jgi:hypothetical protein